MINLLLIRYKEVIAISIIKEDTLSIDNFNQPKQIINEVAIGTQITRLILMEKGTIQSHPDMGVGIRSRYRFADTNKISMLKYDIKNQIECYLPPFYGNIDVDCHIINKVIVINIIANETLFRFTYDQTTDIFKLSEI